MFIETHCHLNHEQFDEDLIPAIQRARSAGVEQMIVVGFDLESSRKAIELAQNHAALYAAVGVHPHDARHYDDKADKQIRELAARERVVAIGEIGLDFHYDFSSREEQYRAFEAQLALARELALPVIIHCREAYPETLTLLEAGLDRRAGGVMHCWAGDGSDARRALALGMYLGFGGVITFKNAEPTRDVLRETPPDRILLETDAPYLAPVPHRGKRNEPANVPLIAETAARVLAVDAREVETTTTSNALRLFPHLTA